MVVRYALKKNVFYFESFAQDMTLIDHLLVNDLLALQRAIYVAEANANRAVRWKTSVVEKR